MTSTRPINLPSTTPIRFASFLANNGTAFYRQVTAYLGEATGLPTEFVSGLPVEIQDRQVDEGQIGGVFTCGLPYTRKAEARPPRLFLLAAPVMAEPRYEARPVYFSDIIVRADSSYYTLANLRGQSFAYNETYSFSGYCLPAYHLLSLGENWGFFGALAASGAHAISMDWVESGRVAAAAIDSVVLSMELSQRPERRSHFRIVEMIGPMPMPPVVASSGLAAPLRLRFTEALLAMHTQPDGLEILSQAGIQCFAPVDDAHYDPIRHVMQTLQQQATS